MTLHARLEALEARVHALLPPGRCDACGFPAPELPPVLLLEDGEEAQRCASCGRLVDAEGQAVATAWAGRPVPAAVVELHERREPVPLPMAGK